ncbi:MAG: flagellar basal body-associated FliL family protein [Bacillota bacterium]|nr:flagellar basal body-associated FliL family protein [Bacillota bacterium]
MEGKGSFFILILIVALLTLTLAVLAGYLFFAGSSSSKTPAQVSQQASSVVPSDSDLTKKLLFTDKTYFNLKNDGTNKISVIEVNVELDYFKTVKGLSGKVDDKITAYDGQIKELIGTYFQNMTFGQAESPDAKITAKKELTKQINELLVETEKDKTLKILYSVNFPLWFYQ